MIPLMVKPLIRFAQSLIKALDPYAFTQLKPFIGKHCCVSITDIGDFTFEITTTGLILSNFSHDEHRLEHNDCIIQGKLSAYLDLLFKHQRLLPGHGITLSGDIRLAQTLFDCFGHLDLDWAGTLERYLPGPFVALLAQSLARESHIFPVPKRSLSAFLTDETHILPSRAAFSRVERQVLNLNKESEQLTMRLSILERKLS